ncbi:MAG: acyltransferase family protein [Cellulophaga sp.]
MKPTPNKTKRIHSLDALRAVMMLLGVIIHSALTYNVTNHGKAWILKDPNSVSIFTDFIVLLIHSFRMPLFFMVAGFFGALLFYERHPISMLKNRISRIGYPFILFLFLLWPFVIFTFQFTEAIFIGNNNPFSHALTSLNNIIDFLPKGTFHLWFLYSLLYITIAIVILALLLRKSPRITLKISYLFNYLIQKPILRIFVFITITYIICFLLNTSLIEASVSFLPDRNSFVFFSIFYIVGWLLFKSKQHLESLLHYDWLCTILAIVIISTQAILIKYANLLGLMPNSNTPLAMFLNSLIVWLFTFGITGLFIRYSRKQSNTMRYISDASYWVYLIHLPITALLPSFIVDWPIPAFIKFIIVVLATSVICFVSYHYLVRSTFMGKFLNGRKYLRK